MKLDHGRAIALIILLTITATSSATWYLTVHSLSAPTLPSYDYPGSGQNYWAYFIYQDTGGTWLRIRGDTRLQDDWSAADPIVADPVALINRALTILTSSQTLVVKGDFSTAVTINIGTNQIGGYSLYGTETYTGSGDAYLINIPQAASDPTQDSATKIYVYRLLGPGGPGSFSGIGNSVGFHIKNLVRSTLEVGALGFTAGGIAGGTHPFKEGIKLDGTVDFSQAIADNRIKYGGIASQIGIHFTGSSCGVCFMEGNNFDGIIGIGSNAGWTAGILLDSGVDASDTVFFGTDDPGTGGPAWVNNAVLSNTVLLFDFLNDQPVNPNVYNGQELRLMTSQGCVGSATCNGLGRTIMLPTVIFQEEQLGVSFTTATSKAVTFPFAQNTATYSVVVVFHQNSGSYWISSLTTAGCTINWTTSSTGTLDYFVYR